MPAVEELPSCQPTGNGRGPQPYRRKARRVRKIDFAQLDGLSTSADQELRETEDALVAFMVSAYDLICRSPYDLTCRSVSAR